MNKESLSLANLNYLANFPNFLQQFLTFEAE